MSNKHEEGPNQAKGGNGEMRVAHFKVCPCCKSADLVKFEMDFFCMDCDWNSILFDVYSGNFERRIGIMNRNRSRSKVRDLRSGVIHLEEINSSRDKSVFDDSRIIKQSFQLLKTGGAK